MQGGAMSAATASEAAAYGVGLNKSGPLQPQPQHGATRVRLAYTHDGTAVYKHTPPPMYQTPAAAATSPRTAPVRGMGGKPAPAPAEQHKRKRSRPRKYAVTDVLLAVVPPSPPKAAAADAGAAQSPATPTLPPGFSSGLASCGGAASQSAPPQALPASERVLPHKKRGRPPGSGNKHQQRPQQQKAAAPGSSVIGLKPNIITVQVGEDLVSRVMSFTQNGWAVCVLSANGAVSNMTLRQAGSSGATTVNYEGHFEILSLSGSYLLSESDGLSSRSGELSVSLAGPDGRVLGGGVAGPLNAATPVQVVIGSFLADGMKGSKQAAPVGAPYPGVSTPNIQRDSQWILRRAW